MHADVQNLSHFFDKMLEHEAHFATRMAGNRLALSCCTIPSRINPDVEPLFLLLVGVDVFT